MSLLVQQAQTHVIINTFFIQGHIQEIQVVITMFVLERLFYMKWGMFLVQYTGPGLLCNTDKSIMNNTHLYEDLGLSDDDKCMYKKLYCPGKTSVEEIKATEVAIKIFPNPTDNNMLNLQISNPFNYQINYNIVSPIGNSVLSGNILPNENTKSINLEDIPTGIYVIVLNYNDNKKIEKFIINK
jgi:hypothetical protein